MNVKELIAKLKKLDPSAMVVVNGYEGGYAEVGQIEDIKLALNVNTEWYYGPHEERAGGEVAAILISASHKL